MGRPRKFDESTAVKAAVGVFRQRGYAGTSIDHLVEVTGVHRGSLYGVFGSKHGLFLRGLDLGGEPSTSVDECLDILLVALLELAPTDRTVRDRVSDLLHRSGTTPQQLGHRLLARAELNTEGESA